MNKMKADLDDTVRTLFVIATQQRREAGYYVAKIDDLLIAIMQEHGTDTRTTNAWLWKIAIHKNVECTPEYNIRLYPKHRPKFRTAVWDDNDIPIIEEVEPEPETIEDELSLLDAIPMKG